MNSSLDLLVKRKKSKYPTRLHDICLYSLTGLINEYMFTYE